MNILQCSFNAVTILLVARNKLEFKQTPLSYLNAALGSQKKVINAEAFIEYIRCAYQNPTWLLFEPKIKNLD